MIRKPAEIAIIGAGAWGTALAICLHAAGQTVTLWGRASVAMERLVQDRIHPSLGTTTLHRDVDCTTMLQTVAIADVVILATPAQTQRAMARELQGIIAPDVPVIIAAKGVETGTGLLMTEAIATVLHRNPVGMLSGPTFATELARGLPSAATLAMSQIALADAACALFTGSALRLYASDDVTGVALGGAYKNVLAIAAGAVMGAELGANARAAIVSRGLAELMRLGRSIDARLDTLSGLSGLGDIVLSCTDAQSRNYAYGHALGRGVTPPARLAEGALTVAPLLKRAARHGVELPIAHAVHDVVNHDVRFEQAVESLLNRPEGRE